MGTETPSSVGARNTWNVWGRTDVGAGGDGQPADQAAGEMASTMPATTTTPAAVIAAFLPRQRAVPDLLCGDERHRGDDGHVGHADGDVAASQPVEHPQRRGDRAVQRAIRRDAVDRVLAVSTRATCGQTKATLRVVHHNPRSRIQST